MFAHTVFFTKCFGSNADEEGSHSRHYILSFILFMAVIKAKLLINK